MPILRKPPAAIVRKAVTIRMPEPIVIELHQYAKFLDGTLDHVVVEALQLVFKKDREFRQWLSENSNLDSQHSDGDSEDSTSGRSSLQPDNNKGYALRATGGEPGRIDLNALRCLHECKLCPISVWNSSVYSGRNQNTIKEQPTNGCKPKYASDRP